jgi:hypothetical protein
MENSVKEIVLSFIEHSSWPLAVLVCVFLLRDELRKLIDRLRALRAGSVEFQLSEQLQTQGLSKDQLKSIVELSADELEMFLLASFTDYKGFRYSIPLPAETFKARMLALQQAGLIQIANPEDPGTNLIHNTTPLGRRFRSLLLNSTARLVKDAA